jgi:hypothetical protein
VLSRRERETVALPTGCTRMFKSMPESAVHVRCVFPPYDRRIFSGTEVLALTELIMVEYFRSPWQMEWKRCVASAPVAIERNSPL